jgi:hypothetical protein
MSSNSSFICLFTRKWGTLDVPDVTKLFPKCDLHKKCPDTKNSNKSCPFRLTKLILQNSNT